MKFIKKVTLVITLFVIEQINLSAMVAQAQLNNLTRSISSAINPTLFSELKTATEKWYEENFPTAQTNDTYEETMQLWNSLLSVFTLYHKTNPVSVFTLHDETNPYIFWKYIGALYKDYQSQGENDLKIPFIQNGLYAIFSNLLSNLQGQQNNNQATQSTSLLNPAMHDIGAHHATFTDQIQENQQSSNQEIKSSKAFLSPSLQPQTPPQNQVQNPVQIKKAKQPSTPPNPNLLSVNDLVTTMPAETVATKQQLSVSESLITITAKTISQSADELMTKCYISPEMQCAVLSLVGRDWSIDKKSGIVPNIPTVQKILDQADSNLSDLENININTPALLKEQGYQNIANALKAAIEAVNIAIFVDRVQTAYQDQDYLLYQKLDTDIYNQLTEYKKELIDKLADKRLQPTLLSQLASFGSWMLSFVWAPSKLKADNALEQMILDNNYKNIKSDSSGRRAANLLFKQCFIAQQLDKNIDLKISNLSDLLANVADIDGFCKIAQNQGLKTNSIASIDDKSNHLIALHQSILNIRQAVQTALYIANKNSTFNFTYIPSPSSIPGMLGYIPQPSFLASYLDPIVGQLLEYDKKLAAMSIDKKLGAHQNDIFRNQLWTAISYMVAGLALGTAVYTDYQHGFGTSAGALIRAPGNAIDSVSNGYDAVYNYFKPALPQPPVDQKTLLNVMSYKEPKENAYDKTIKVVPMPKDNSQDQNIFNQIKNAVTGGVNQIKNAVTSQVKNTPTNSNYGPSQQAGQASSKKNKASSPTTNSQNNKIDKDVNTLIDKIEDIITSTTTPGELATGIVGVGVVGGAALKLKSGIKAANNIGTIAGSGAAQGISQLSQEVMTGGPTGFPAYEKPAVSATSTTLPATHAANTKALTIYNPPAQINNKLGTAGMLGAGAVGAAAVGALANTAKIGFTGKDLAGNVIHEADFEKMINNTDQATMDNYVDNGGQSQMKSYDFTNVALNYQNALKDASKTVATKLGVYQGPQQAIVTPPAENQPTMLNDQPVASTNNQ